MFAARYFDRDPETNEVLWFPGPPVDIAHPTEPKHSLEYLHFLAMKRKRQLQGAEADIPNENAEEEGSERKRARQIAPPLASQLLSELLAVAEAS